MHQFFSKWHEIYMFVSETPWHKCGNNLILWMSSQKIPWNQLTQCKTLCGYYRFYCHRSIHLQKFRENNFFTNKSSSIFISRNIFQMTNIKFCFFSVLKEFREIIVLLHHYNVNCFHEKSKFSFTFTHITLFQLISRNTFHNGRVNFCFLFTLSILFLIFLYNT